MKLMKTIPKHNIFSIQPLKSYGAGRKKKLLPEHRSFFFQVSLLRDLVRISDGGLTPAADTNLLFTVFRGGSHPASDIFSVLYLSITC